LRSEKEEVRRGSEEVRRENRIAGLNIGFQDKLLSSDIIRCLSSDISLTHQTSH
jgi:hypothetical protein